MSWITSRQFTLLSGTVLSSEQPIQCEPNHSRLRQTSCQRELRGALHYELDGNLMLRALSQCQKFGDLMKGDQQLHSGKKPCEAQNNKAPKLPKLLCTHLIQRYPTAHDDIVTKRLPFHASEPYRRPRSPRRVMSCGDKLARLHCRNK